jgi:hypothetical protein
MAALCLMAAGGCDQLVPGSRPSPSPTPITSGIRGIVLLGPTCPVVRAAASPCLEPYSARLVIMDGNGLVVTEVTSGSDGRFEVALAPGEYTLVPAPAGDPFPNAKPASVSVTADEYTEVEIDYDTGIR